MDPNKTLNMTMLCDFYELTMGNGYLDHNMQDRITYFDVFFRSVPDDGGYAIAAGLEQIIDYIQNLHFTDEDIAYLRGRKLFSEAFLDYLKNFHFTGDIWAVPEGTPVFPREPLITVRAPAIQAQLVETYLLLQINHQSLIATKANRIARAARGRTVLEFGSRRAQGADAAIISQEGFGNPTTDLMHVCRGLEKRGVKTVIITNEDAGTDGMSESLPDVVTEANAIVSTGNSNATILLPKMDRVLGELKEVERVTGGNVDSIKPDGTLLLEIHGIMGGHNLQGNTYLSATTV